MTSLDATLTQEVAEARKTIAESRRAHLYALRWVTELNQFSCAAQFIAAAATHLDGDMETAEALYHIWEKAGRHSDIFEGSSQGTAAQSAYLAEIIVDVDNLCDELSEYRRFGIGSREDALGYMEQYVGATAVWLSRVVTNGDLETAQKIHRIWAQELRHRASADLVGALYMEGLTDVQTLNGALNIITPGGHFASNELEIHNWRAFISWPQTSVEWVRHLVDNVKFGSDIGEGKNIGRDAAVASFFETNSAITTKEVEMLLAAGVNGSDYRAAISFGFHNLDSIANIGRAIEQTRLDRNYEVAKLSFHHIADLGIFNPTTLERVIRAGFPAGEVARLSAEDWASAEELLDWSANSPKGTNLAKALLLETGSFEALSEAAGLELSDGVTRILHDSGLRLSVNSARAIKDVPWFRNDINKREEFRDAWWEDGFSDALDRVGSIVPTLGQAPSATVAMLARRATAEKETAANLFEAIENATDDQLLLAVAMAEDRAQDGQSVNYRSFMKNLQLI